MTAITLKAIIRRGFIIFITLCLSKFAVLSFINYFHCKVANQYTKFEDFLLFVGILVILLVALYFIAVSYLIIRAQAIKFKKLITNPDKYLYKQTLYKHSKQNTIKTNKTQNLLPIKRT